MKKYLLKGKDFIMKKLDELEIERGDIDYISEQIPRRLLDKLKVLDSADYDLEPASLYANYFRTYPNHPISPLLTERMKDQKPMDYKLKPKIEQHRTSIPDFDDQLQKKALTFKTVVDSYDEGIPEMDANPLVCICVVHFHHKRGTQVEYRYPFDETIEKIENTIVHCAMPDSSHNKAEDFNFFNFEAEIKGTKRMLFGVSYFKQIKLTEAMKAKNQELTRSHLQKAVCVVSLLPVFGYLKTRLAPTTKIFFDNFTNFESINHAYLDISKHLNQSWPKIDLSELHFGSDLRRILQIFRYRFFEIYKAVLHMKRIVVFSHSSSSSSSFILSLLSLFPGMLTFGMHSAPINRYLEGLREYALPLKLFSSENPLILSFHIQDFDLLARFKKSNVKGNYLIGTTNRLVKESKNISMQFLVNLESCEIDYLDTEEVWEGVTKQEKAFVDQILKVLEEEYTCGYEGSEDWIRDKFHAYLKDKLAEFVDAKNKYIKFAEDCRVYSAKRKKSGGSKAAAVNNREYEFMEDEEQMADAQKKRKDRVPEVDPIILHMPFAQLLGQPHFMYFLQFHNPNLYLLTEKYPVEEIMLIDNHEYYFGSLPKQSGEFIIYNLKAKKLRYGNHQKFKKVKELKFDDTNQITQVFVGMIDDNKYNGPGFLINESECFQGDFENNSKDGFGKLVTPLGTYIGNFLQGLYHGEGQLVTSDGVIYSGLFKEGIKEGQGRLQKVGFVYQGDFHENEMCGKGNISLEKENIKVFGGFVKGKLDQSQQCAIRFGNGDAYAGYLKNLKPEGKGTLRKANGDIIEGQFQNGVLVRRKQTNNVEKQEQVAKTQPSKQEQVKKEEPIRQVPKAQEKNSPKTEENHEQPKVEAKEGVPERKQ